MAETLVQNEYCALIWNELKQNCISRLYWTCDELIIMRPGRGGFKINRAVKQVENVLVQQDLERDKNIRMFEVRNSSSGINSGFAYTHKYIT